LGEFHSNKFKKFNLLSGIETCPNITLSQASEIRKEFLGGRDYWKDVMRRM